MAVKRVSGEKTERIIKILLYLILCTFLLPTQCAGADNPLYTLTIPPTKETLWIGDELKFLVKVDQNRYEICPDCSVFFYINGPDRTYHIGSIPYSFSDEAKFLEYPWLIPPWIPEGEYTYYAGVSDSRGFLLSDMPHSNTFTLLKYPTVQEGYPAKITELKTVPAVETGDVAVLAARVSVTDDCEGCKIRFYVDSTNTEWNKSHWVGAIPYSKKVGAGWFEYNWEIPADLKAGTYTYSAIVYDSSEKIMKSPWSENSVFNVLETGYPMKITGLLDINTMQQGDIAILGARVTSVDNYPCSDCNVWFYMDGPLKGDEKWIGPVKYDINDKDKWFRYQWEIPEDITAGTYTYSAKVFGKTRKIEKSKGSTTKKFLIKAVGNLLRISDMRNIGTIEQGGKISLAVKLARVKDVECGDCIVKFRLIKPDGKIRFVGSVKFKEEYIGKWLGLDWTLSDEIETGIYYYQARVVDSTGKINKSDWSAKKRFEIKKKTKDHILKIDYLLDIGTVEQGDIIELGAKIDRLTNKECEDCIVWYWLDAPGTSEDRWLTSTRYLEQNPLSRFEWRIPYNAVTGVYRYKVRVFDNDKEVRKSEFSEIKEFKVVKRKYSLEMSDIRDVTSTKRGDTIEFRVKVESLDDGSCEDCGIWFYIDGPKKGDERWVGSVEYDAKDSDKWFTYRWIIPEDIYVGAYKARAMAFDKTRKFRESLFSKAIKFDILE